MTPLTEAVIATVAAGLVLGYWGWIGLSLVRLKKDVVALEHDVADQKRYCGERLEWLRKLSCKMESNGEGIARIEGALNIPESPDMVRDI
jgi:hypothetical protein